MNAVAVIVVQLATTTLSLIPSPVPSGEAASSAGGWVPLLTAVAAAVVAAIAALVGAYLQRKTGRESVAATRESAAAAERSAKAAEASVELNAATATAAGRRSDAESLSKRYQEASGQLGHDKAAVRLAGVYSMARLADDWPEQRQTCIDVLCAYLRLPPSDTATDVEKAAEEEVRSAVMASIVERYAISAPGKGWHASRLDLHGITFCNFTFQRLSFDGLTSLRGARFIGDCKFVGCRFSRSVDMTNWSIEGGTLTVELPTTRAGVRIHMAGGRVAADATFNPTFRMDKGDTGFSVDLRDLTIDGGSFEMDVPRLKDPQSIDLENLTIKKGSSIHFAVVHRSSYGPGEYEWMDVRDSPFLDPKAESWTVDPGAQIQMNPDLFKRPGWPLRPS